MANKKMSDTAVFKTGTSNIAYNNIANIDGVVGWSNFTGANENVAISGTQLVTSLESNLYTSAPLPIAKGGTGITKYGEACEMFLDVATIGGVSIGNTNNDTTYVAPLTATAFNDDATLYTPTPNTSTGAANWTGGIQVLVAGKYLIEGQYFSFDGQANAQMEVWAEVNAANNPHSASWPTSATAGDIYLLGDGKTSTTLSGNAGQTGSRIVTVGANDYVRILFRHADFSGTGFPVWEDNFAGGTVTGLEGYRVRLTITRMA